MRDDPEYVPITVEQFLSIDFGSDKKLELVDGVIRMMAGGTRRHAQKAGNIIAFLRTALRGSGCGPYGSDMGVQTSETNLHYPDVSVLCGDPDRRDLDFQTSANDPVVIFEVLSPATAKADQGEKLGRLRTLASLDTIVFVDPDNELTRIIQRLGPTSWHDDLFAAPHDVELPKLGITVPHGEIFARD